jgi:hypothetical protein
MEKFRASNPVMSDDRCCMISRVAGRPEVAGIGTPSMGLV